MLKQLSKIRSQPKHLPKYFPIKSFGTDIPPNDQKPQSKGFFDKWFGPQTWTSPPSFKNRWLIVLPAFATHFCIGSPWAWSVMASTICHEQGFVTSAAGDWAFGQCVFPLSLIFAFQGISAALAGKYQMKYGPRASMALAATCFGGGLMIGSFGIYIHSLPLLYLGYGVLGGCGVGIAYTPPLQALIEWFPDKKGLASGLCIAGFGSGALFFAPLVQKLFKQFQRLPEYVGAVGDVAITTEGGKLFAQIGGQLKEVVSANAADLSKLSGSLQEGFYIVGSGDTGAAQALFCSGALYLGVMMLSAFSIKRPAKGYLPQGWNPPAPVKGQQQGNVALTEVMKTPQFYMLGSFILFVATGGMAVFAVAKPMMSEVFGRLLPGVVTNSFAASYVLMLSAGNLIGRLAWASFSDRFGRRLTFQIFTLGSIPLYFSLPLCIQYITTSPSVIPLMIFIGSTITSISIMGGVYSTLPAYEADLFGSKYVGPIHGRMLIFSSAAALSGPSLLIYLRGLSEKKALSDLLTKVDPIQFQNKFGQSINNADELIQAKTVNISKLMEILPGVQDPTPFLYDTTMYTMGGIMGIAAIASVLVKPVDKKYFENYQDQILNKEQREKENEKDNDEKENDEKKNHNSETQKEKKL